MECLEIIEGKFSDGENWRSGDYTEPANGVQIKYIDSGSPGLEVIKNGKKAHISKDPDATIEYAFFGALRNYILVLTTKPAKRIVDVVNVTGDKPDKVKTIEYQVPSNVKEPNFQVSKGGGGVFLLVKPIIDDRVEAEMYRSADGKYLFGVNPVDITKTLTGEATEKHLVINLDGKEWKKKLRDKGECFVYQADFKPIPAGSTDVQTFTIQNIGYDCLKIVSIQETGIEPFSIVNISKPLTAVLGHNETITVDVQYAPTQVGKDFIDIDVVTSPAEGECKLKCLGSVCTPVALMTLPPKPLSDIKVQQGFRTVKIFKVQNTGSIPLKFTAAIEGGNKLFGIQLPGKSIIDSVQSVDYVINPVEACGNGITKGTGVEYVPITFFADGEPDTTVTAQLIIKNHNASGQLPEIIYDLKATITAPVSLDVELVLDHSGSMKDSVGQRKKIDTAVSAGKLFVELTREGVGDRVGVVKFNTTPEVVSDIQDITATSKTAISDEINVNNFNPEGNTSIAGGVLRAQENMNEFARKPEPPPDKLNKAIVVLTDGIDNSPYTAADGHTYSLAGGLSGGIPGVPGFEGVDTEPVLPKLSADIKIYAVGIGRDEDIDKAQLSILAQATGGNFQTAQSFSDGEFFQLEKVFTQIYMQNVGIEHVKDPVYAIKPGETHVNEFDVLRGDVSAMVVLYDSDGIRAPFYLETPSGETIDVTSVPAGYQLRSGVTPTARFIEVQMPPNEPDRYAGRWKTIVKHDGKACYFPDTRSYIADIGIDDESGYGFGFQPKNCKEYDKEIIYGIAFGVGSNFRMMPYVQPGIISTGESIRLTADITEFGLPVTNCKVTVETLAPDGKISNLTLYDDGAHSDNDVNDGCYGNVFTDTFAGGSYQFTFRAEGKSHDDEPVYREAIRSKYVEGVVPVAPKDSPITGKGKDCCRYMYILMIIIIVLLIIIIFILLYMLFKP